jgi:hypothetical protein
VRHLPLALLLAILLLGLGADPAHAADWVEGDGYRFRLPDGFRPVEDGPMRGGGFNMAFGGDLEMEVRAFARDPRAPQGGTLMVMRILATGELGRQFREQMSYQNLRAQMAQGQDQIGRVLGQRGLELDALETTTLGAAHPAVLIDAVQVQPGMGEVRSRIAITQLEESLYMFMLMGSEANATQDEVAWTTLTTSVQLFTPNPVLHFVKHRWPWILGGVGLLFVLFLKLRRSNPARGATRRTYRPVGAPGAGLSRPVDGLPTYQEEVSPASADLQAGPLGATGVAARPAAPSGPLGLGDRVASEGGQAGEYEAPPAPAAPPRAAGGRRKLAISRVPSIEGRMETRPDPRLDAEPPTQREEHPRIRGNTPD